MRGCEVKSLCNLEKLEVNNFNYFLSVSWESLELTDEMAEIWEKQQGHTRDIFNKRCANISYKLASVSLRTII